MKYELLIERGAQKQLAKIPQPHQDRIITAIRDLAGEPRPAGVKELAGRDAWRIRVGDYRIIYEIRDKALVILDDFVKSRQGRRHSKKLQMQGARILRNEAYIEVRCNDER